MKKYMNFSKLLAVQVESYFAYFVIITLFFKITE